MNIDRKFYIIGAIIVVLIGVIGYIQFRDKTPKPESVAFNGVISNVASNAMEMKGQYILSNGPSDQAQFVQVKVNISDMTKITKIVTHTPKYEDTVKDGFLIPTQPKRDVVPVSFEEFKKDMENDKSRITIKSAKNIYNKSEFEASEIEYGKNALEPETGQ